MDAGGMNNRIKIEEIKCEIDDIHARTLLQRNDLPNLRHEHRSLRDEYQRAMIILNNAKTIQNSIKTEMDAEMAKANVFQNKQQQQELLRKALVQEREICNGIINKERTELLKLVCDHEQRTSELTDMFHNAPVLYSSSALQKEVDEISSSVDRLLNKLTVTEGEKAALRSCLAFPDSKPMKGDTLTQKDSRSVELVLQDTNMMDKMMLKLSADEQILEKQSRQLQQEITNVLVSRDALFKNRQNTYGQQ